MAKPSPWSLVVALGLAACRVDPLPATGTLSLESFESDAVGDTYRLRIRMPPDDGSPGPYPLVIQLDPTYVGLQQYAITVGLVSQHADDGDWAEAIVVGVDYDDPSLRERDYALPDPPSPEFDGEGADRYYRMLRDELLPELESRFPIASDRRFLLGHSNGGILAWYAAFRHDPAVGDPLFAGVVAADNGYPESLFTYERWHHQRADDLPMTIYSTRAAFNGAAQKVGFDVMHAHVEDRGFPSLVLEYDVLETDHAGAVWPSYERGLDLLLGGAR